MIDVKNFPTFTENHYKDLMSYETEIQEHFGYLVKRDDLFNLGGISGGKVRQCLRIVYDNLDDIKTE